MLDTPLPPHKDAKDVALGLVRTVVSAVPGFGGPAVELLGLVLKAPLERRRDEFLTDLGVQLAALESDGVVSLKQLSEDAVFVDNVLHATLAALRTRHQTKRDALRNAVLNSVLPGAPESDIQEILIGLVDSLVPWHLAILALLAQETPPPYPEGSITIQFHSGLQHAGRDQVRCREPGRRVSYL
jgi:hypothetical protein